MSQRIRKRIEEGFGWCKEFGLLRRIRMRGRARVDMAFTLILLPSRAPELNPVENIWQYLR